jgi:hypothetical protein
MQLELVFLLLVGVHLLSFFVGVVLLFISLFFASRIVTNRLVSIPEAFIGALATLVIYQICGLILFFVIPGTSDLIALIIAVVALSLLLNKYIDIGIFSSVALIMLCLAILLAIQVSETAITYIFFVPLPG